MNNSKLCIMTEGIKILFFFRLTDFLEDIFAAPNFFNVLVGSIEICALGFNLTVSILF